MYHERVVTTHSRGNSARGIDILVLDGVFLIERWEQASLGELLQASCGRASRFHRPWKAWQIPFRLICRTWPWLLVTVGDAATWSRGPVGRARGGETGSEVASR